MIFTRGTDTTFATGTYFVLSFDSPEKFASPFLPTKLNPKSSNDKSCRCSAVRVGNVEANYPGVSELNFLGC